MGQQYLAVSSQHIAHFVFGKLSAILWPTCNRILPCKERRSGGRVWGKASAIFKLIPRGLSVSFFMDDSVRGWAGWDAVSWVLGLAMRWRQAKLDIVWDTDGGLSLPVKTSRFIKIVQTTAMSSKSTDSRQRYYKNKDKDQSVSNLFSDVSLLAGEFEWVSACDSCIVQHVFTHDKL